MTFSGVYEFVTGSDFVGMLKMVAGGLGLFLLGMKMMSDGLQSAAGQRMSRWISAVTDNRLMAVLVGVGVTGIIQSSSATTVMVVGLVNGGVMTLMQAIGVIFGANIGTTVTAWIVTMNLSKYGLLMVGIAAMPYLFTKKDRTRNISLIFLGLGLLFAGLEFMSSGFKPLSGNESVLAWFNAFEAVDFTGVLKCIAVGTVLTMIIQSSSASIAIVIMLAKDGLIGLDTALALVLGGNIGTTITAFLASIGTSRNAKRSAYAHTLFNVLGVIWVTAVFHSIFFPLVEEVTPIVAKVFPSVVTVDKQGTGKAGEIALGIAVGHSIFNIVNTILFLPIMGWFATAVKWLVPVHESERLAEEGKRKFGVLDRRMLVTPALAIEQSHNEIVSMGEMNIRMLERLKPIMLGEDKFEEDFHMIQEGESLLDDVQHEIMDFVSQIIARKPSQTIAAEARRQMRQADELESVSDYVVRLSKSRNRILKLGVQLTDEAKQELSNLHTLAADYATLVTRLLRDRDATLIPQCRRMSVTTLEAFKHAHTQLLQRLTDEKVSAAKSVVYSDILLEYRGVSDHLQNVVDTIEDHYEPHSLQRNS